MRRIILISIMLLAGISATAQQRQLNPAATFDDESGQVYFEKLRYCYSKEGRANWKPEFTLRAGTMIFQGFGAVTAGVRVNDRSTLSLMALDGSVYIDAYPAHVNWAGAAIAHRRLMPFGPRGILSLSSDIYAGAGYVYKVSGAQDEVYTDSDGNEFVHEGYHGNEVGDILPVIGWQPALRLRIYRNFHIFLGGAISTHGTGIVMGLGL